MASQFLLNLFIALLWVLLKDEDAFYFNTLSNGFLIGVFIVFLMRRFFGGQFYLQRVLAIIKLIFLFISELLQSSVVVIRHILSPRINIEPGIFTYKTNLRGEWEVSVLALLLTLTPGSVVMEINPGGDTFYIHAMDINRYQKDLEKSLEKFEKAIMGVTR